MNRRVTTFCAGVAGVVFCVLMSALPAAQGRASDAQPQDATDVTVTGCLQRGIDGRFVVAKLDVTEEPDASRVDANPANEPIPASQVVKSWWLEGGTGLDRHIGERIEVVGHDVTAEHAEADAAAAGAAAPGAAAREAGATGTAGTSGEGTTTGDAADSAHDAGHLRVKSVKGLGAGCS